MTATLPSAPFITIAQCQSAVTAKTYLRVLLAYLKEAAPVEHSPAMLATNRLREDTGQPLTDYQYATECAHQTVCLLTNAEVEAEQTAQGFRFDLDEPENPFELTEAGKTMFMRPLAFASIFGPGWGTRKVYAEATPAKYLHAKNPVTGDWFEYWGPELRQEDLSVLLWFAKQNEGRRPGTYLDFDAKQLLTDIGRSVHVKNLNWLFGQAIKSLERANLVLFNAQTGHRKAYGLLKTEYHYDRNEDGEWVFSLKKSQGRFRLDPDYRSLLALHNGLRQTYIIDLDVRKSLAAKPLALWLQMFVSAHLANPAIKSPGKFTRDVAVLKSFCYGESCVEINDKEFARRLKDAAILLQEQKVIKSFNIWRGKATFEGFEEDESKLLVP